LHSFEEIATGTGFPGVHFFRNNVGFLAHTAGEQAGVFKNRRANLAKVVAGEDRACGGLDFVPESRFRRQKIACAADGF
jgi:hypothetical protein